jgi:hypothetical protein
MHTKTLIIKQAHVKKQPPFHKHLQLRGPSQFHDIMARGMRIVTPQPFQSRASQGAVLIPQEPPKGSETRHAALTLHAPEYQSSYDNPRAPIDWGQDLSSTREDDDTQILHMQGLVDDDNTPPSPTHTT